MRQGAKREEIMRAAEQLFAERRFHEITLDEVTRLAHVGKGTIYRYFKSKDDLFISTVTRGFDELCDLLAEKVPDPAPFAEKLVAMAEEIDGFFSSRRHLFRMMQDARSQQLRGEMWKHWMEKHKKLVGAVAGIVEAGVAEGHIRSDVPARTLAAFLLSMMRTRARELGWSSDGVPSLETVVDLFLRGADRNEHDAAAVGKGEWNASQG